jgi:plastocyanin
VTHAFGDAVKGSIGAFRVGNPPQATVDGHSAAAAEGALAVTAKDPGLRARDAPGRAGEVKVELRNSGVLPHDVTIDGKGPVAAGAGQTAGGAFTLPKGTYTFYCSIPGRQAGMAGRLIVD